MTVGGIDPYLVTAPLSACMKAAVGLAERTNC